MIKFRPLSSGLVTLAVAGIITGCTMATAETESAKSAASTAGGPTLAPLDSIKMPIPPDNKQTDAKIALGKLLFFDPRLGGDASISCSSCHDPEQGWAWAEDFSRGYPGTVHWRNSQSIINSQYYGRQFWAGAAASGEKQAPSAAKGGVAGNGENDIMEARLALIPEYRKAFKEVFGDEWPLIGNAWRAIASFERTLAQTDTPLDNYLKGDKTALSEEQIRGKAVFEGKGGCVQCHNGALSSNEDYVNVGVPPATRWQEDGLAQITFRFEQYAKGQTEEGYRKAKSDWGLYYRTKNKWDKGKFRVPSLRYTKYTAPYMHNGAFYTFEEVVDFYNSGGFDEEGRTTLFPENKDKRMKPLGLTEAEKSDLVAFLDAFSGEEIMMDKPTLPEYAPLFTKAELEAVKK
ncbi:cytochrome c peroxidase [Candidatus Venteria ishoeyi]|uniref:cytochrome-c peroxidase n=1 Tax=Candidatus Venteria ishoeyi TaxID=1899563 RepID=UPI0025A62C11|nr:cytochrome c peroxidase [Candidatus Venteria ishoeyi]MDM8547054.1 cytochrome c peroxidase [Candidatus Venteria ishoeyi]